MKIIVFSVNGKTFIGQWVYKSSSLTQTVFNNLSETSADGNIVVPSEKYLVIYAPAAIEWNLEMTNTTSAELGWKVTPLMFGAVFATAGVNNYWVFNRSEVAISAIREEDIDKTLIAAYKEVIA